MYCYAVVGSALGANKSHLGLFNGAGSGRVLRVWRVDVVPHLTATVTGLTTSFVLSRTTTVGNGTASVLRKADPSEDTPPAQVAAQHSYSAAPNEAANSELAELALTTEETVAPTPKHPLFQADPNCGVVPIVVREGGGVVIKQTALAGAGACSVFLWFTAERW